MPQNTLSETKERYRRLFKGTVMWQEHESFLLEELAQAVAEAVHLGVNKSTEWYEEYSSDKNFTGTFGDWIDRKIAQQEANEHIK